MLLFNSTGWRIQMLKFIECLEHTEYPISDDIHNSCFIILPAMLMNIIKVMF